MSEHDWTFRSQLFAMVVSEDYSLEYLVDWGLPERPLLPYDFIAKHVLVSKSATLQSRTQIFVLTRKPIHTFTMS
jgi:hypothetical protein